MQIVTTREFRANQKKYFEMAETETILVSRRNAAPIMVCAVREGDVPDTFCCAVLLGISVVYRACGFRVCLRVWDRFYLSPSPLLISRWGGCSIEQQEEKTGQALFFPLALRGYALKIKALEKLTVICWL